MHASFESGAIIIIINEVVFFNTLILVMKVKLCHFRWIVFIILVMVCDILEWLDLQLCQIFNLQRCNQTDNYVIRFMESSNCGVLFSFLCHSGL
ncbi:hypothetical protein J1N35_026705, partial [Gossypium stocksii]